MEYRVEELARRSGVAVDTIRFYQGKGLLPAPRRQGRVTYYDKDHLARLERIRRLQSRGFSLAVIRRFLEGELEGSDEALVEAVTRPAAPESLTLEELASRTGVAVPLLQTLEKSGLLTEPYTASDVDALSAGLRLLEAGIPMGDLMDLAREHAEATERTARRAVELFDKHVRERLQSQGGDVEPELMDQFSHLLEASGTLVRHHFERTLLRAARAHIERS